MRRTTAEATVEVLRALFSRCGLPLELVSDNAPQFVAGEFQTFLKINCIKHTLGPPYHPSSNDLAERHVQTFKRMYQACPEKGSLLHKIDALHNSAFLFPVARKRGYGCINLQNSTGNGGRTRSKQ